MAIRVYCGVPNESSEADLRKYDSLFNKLGMHMIVTHMEVSYITELERSIVDIDRAERDHPDKSNQPLQMNSVYSFASVDEKFSARCPIVNLLKRTKLKKPFKVNINVSLPQEKDIKTLPFPVGKDIVISDDVSGKEVGWYNLAANILWLSDAFHVAENLKTLIPAILNPLNEFKRYGKLSDTLTIGIDPEWEIISENDEFISADRYFPEMNGEIGHDGHSATGEFRPKPSRNPLGLARNIKRLVRKLNSMNTMQGCKVWAGGGVNVTSGGHIHFGMKGMPQELKDSLYDLVAEPVLKYQSAFRKKNEASNYERDSGSVVRDQPHGIEWRPLPSFIINEEITCAVLCTTYAITKSYKFHDYKKSKLRVPATPEDYYAIPMYPIYKEHIDKFIEMFVKGGLKGTLAKKDLLTEWKVPTIKRDYTVEINCGADWLGAYFKPLNVKLKKPVKLELRFNGDTISTFGIKAEMLDELKEFTDRHFMPPLVFNDKMPKGQGRPLILLPSAWWHMKGRDFFFMEFKNVLKNLVLKMGGC